MGLKMNALEIVSQEAKDLKSRIALQVEAFLGVHFPYGKVGIMAANKEIVDLFAEQTGIYVLYAGNDIIYIGESRELRCRLYAHFSRFTKLGLTTIGIIRLPKDTAEYDRLSLEARLIHRFMPKFNKNNGHLKEDSCHSRVVNIIEIIRQLLPILPSGRNSAPVCPMAGQNATQG